MEGRAADSRLVSDSQFASVRYAYVGITSVYPAEIRLLALFAGLAAARFRKVTAWILLSVVLAYQIVGTLGEWALKSDFYLAVQDFRIGVPGMLLQVFGGWACINKLLKN